MRWSVRNIFITPLVLICAPATLASRFVAELLRHTADGIDWLADRMPRWTL